MTVVGIDDTDSREAGMCTTYVATRIADGLEAAGGAVARRVLVRLCPAAPHKTRGNAALAIHADVDPDVALEIAREAVEAAAETRDPDTHPGVVVAPHGPNGPPDAVRDFARAAVQEVVDLRDAERTITDAGYRAESWGIGRGNIGALAAVGAWPALDDWTTELIAYRHPDRWGTPRSVDPSSVFAAAEDAYPAAWDTVDRGESEAVCVPHTPGPVLYGIRGDDPGTVRDVADRIEGEPSATAALFVTNQGTDAHLRNGRIGTLAEGGSYRVSGTVDSVPETRRGGHVFLDLVEDGPTLQCAAFEPTKRFREHVRALRPGDRITACGEVSDGTLKLEKFAVRDLVRTERVTPTCPGCGRSMESAGADQGYRCRDCGTTAPRRVERVIERDLEPGWYEVPPCARRHIAKPLIRGGFDAPVHPEW